MYLYYYSENSEKGTEYTSQQSEKQLKPLSNQRNDILRSPCYLATNMNGQFYNGLNNPYFTCKRIGV